MKSQIFRICVHVRGFARNKTISINIERRRWMCLCEENLRKIEVQVKK